MRLLLLLQCLCLLLLSFHLVDGLDQHALVFVGVTLCMAVKVVVEVLVDLLLLAVLAEQPSEHTLAAHPQEFRRHARLAPTTALARASVAALADGKEVLAHTRPRVHLDSLPDNQTVLQELAD